MRVPISSGAWISDSRRPARFGRHHAVRSGDAVPPPASRALRPRCSSATRGVPREAPRRGPREASSAAAIRRSRPLHRPVRRASGALPRAARNRASKRAIGGPRLSPARRSRRGVEFALAWSAGCERRRRVAGPQSPAGAPARCSGEPSEGKAMVFSIAAMCSAGKLGRKTSLRSRQRCTSSATSPARSAVGASSLPR